MYDQMKVLASLFHAEMKTSAPFCHYLNQNSGRIGMVLKINAFSWSQFL